METAVSRGVVGSYVEKCKSVNSNVAKRVEDVTGVDPRTKIAGFSPSGTFEVDIKTGRIFVTPVHDWALPSHLLHENGHRAVFPASTPGWMAFTSAVASLCHNCSAEEVLMASNTVSDVFSDYMLFKLGLGSEITKRIDSLISKVGTTVSPLMAFKLLCLEAMRDAVRHGSARVTDANVERAFKQLLSVLALPPAIANEVKTLAERFFDETEDTLSTTSPQDIASYFLDPSIQKTPPPLSYLPRIAVELVKLQQDMQLRADLVELLLSGENAEQSEPGDEDGESGGGGKGGETTSEHDHEGEEEGKGEWAERGTRNMSEDEESGGGEAERDEESGGESEEATSSSNDEGKGEGEGAGDEAGSENEHQQHGDGDPESGDVKLPSEVSPFEVFKAIQAMASFGVDPGRGGVALERVHSQALRSAARKLLERMLSFYSVSQKTVASKWFMKEKAELWLQPHGEPDEDSVLKEKHKLLWQVEVKKPISKQGFATLPSSVPEKAVFVVDESGSTFERFPGTDISVASVEVYIAGLVLAGLKKRGGAKHISVVKFSDLPELVYSGTNAVEATTKMITPHRGAGGGTLIDLAVEKALELADKKTALVVVTDMVIPPDVAEVIAGKLKEATSTGRVELVIFVVTGDPGEYSVSLDIIRNALKGKRSIVTHVASASDLVKLGNAIVSTVSSL